MTEQQTPASVVERLRASAEAIRSDPPFHDREGEPVPPVVEADDLNEAAVWIERLSAEREVLREALANIQIEAERENGRWNHLKRVIAINARAALTQGESRGGGE